MPENIAWNDSQRLGWDMEELEIEGRADTIKTAVLLRYWELKLVVEYEGEGDTNCSWCV